MRQIKSLNTEAVNQAIRKGNINAIQRKNRVFQVNQHKLLKLLTSRLAIGAALGDRGYIGPLLSRLPSPIYQFDLLPEELTIESFFLEFSRIMISGSEPVVAGSFFSDEVIIPPDVDPDCDVTVVGS